MTNTTIRTSNMNAADILNLKHRLEKYGKVIETEQHLITNAPDRAVPQILTRFYDEVFAANNGSRLDKTIHYRDSDGTWNDVHPFTIFETSSEYVDDFEADYQHDVVPTTAGYFSSVAEFRAQLDSVLVI